ncbi:MAG: SIMPL domain-containing protein [Pegethrix bostrychoides GSE-TBD4-15B]|jgi:uncharacterized protein YggE|uniref:SIMPL domain-containing protein n=1 Tax=Pegethrix bostrychoides GSE-TBD4-15B TaxID=2839662 RepID=A0A951PEP9_9CYAN|nr:SIMPL domain-containing protein [Pegethrix bostrychoides GSE-TBD4-15B]
MSQHRSFSAFLALMALSTSTTAIAGAIMVSTAPVSRAAEVDSLQVAQAAQPSSSDSSRTLYVTGTGQTSIPADQAVLILSFYPNSYYSGIDSSDPNATPAQPQVTSSDISAAISAANSAGVSDATAYPNYGSPGTMQVRLVINQPTQSKIEQAVESVNTAIVKSNRYMTSGAAVGYGLRDCNAAENTARQAAMSDANRRAALLAEVSGNQVGEVVSLSESITWGTNYTGTCPVADEPSSYTDISAGYPYYDPAVPPLVRLVYSLSVTYGLR